MRTTNYSVKTAVLYVVMKAMWNSCKERQTAMSGMRAVYSDEYIDNAILQIAAAEALPDDAARSAAHEQIRVQMETLAADCCAKWRLLKLYIRNCYPEVEREIMYNAAGWGDYEAAAHQNWPSVMSMMNAGIEFIEANTARLSDTGLNMPAGFPALFIASATAFAEANANFIKARQEAEEGTAAKIEANNAIYTKTIQMGLDGQECFYTNEEVRKQFTFEAVVNLVSPQGASGVVMTVTNAETNQPLIAEITDSVSDRTVTTDNTGRGEMLNLAAGDTTFMVTCDGFTQQMVNVTLTGTTKHIEVMMVPVFAGLPINEPVTNVTNNGGGNGQVAMAGEN